MSKENSGLSQIMVGLGCNKVQQSTGFLGALFGSKPQDIDYDAFKRNQHFVMLRNAFISAVDHHRGIQLCRFNLNENYNNDAALIAGRITRTNSVWEFTMDGSHARVESLVNVVAAFS